MAQDAELANERNRHRARYWYASAIATANAGLTVAYFILRFGEEGEPVWQYFVAFLLFWIPTFAAAFVFWSRERRSYIKMTVLSLAAVASVWVIILVGSNFYLSGQINSYNVFSGFKRVWELALEMYGLPYLSAICISWFFTTRKTDIKNLF